MKQKIFLTSALAMGFVAPAFAAPSHTGEFPTGGLMQEDYTYTNAATEANMGVYEGEVNATAEYTEIPYSAAEGFYLTGVDNNNDAITAECTSGNFCPGVASTTYENNAFGNTGLQSCSTATSGAYTLSDAGASSSGQCYRTCDGHVSISHATGVTGNDYSDGTNTCAPTGCENGWHVNIPTLATVIGTSEQGAGYIANDPYPRAEGSMSNVTVSQAGIYGDTQAFVVDYGNKGMIKGHGKCSEQEGTGAFDGASRASSASDITTHTTLELGGYGVYCYCSLDSYTPYGSNTSVALSGPWVYASSNAGQGGLDGCRNYCAQNCANKLHSADSTRHLMVRAAIFNAYPEVLAPAMCEANTITINWNGTTQEAINANNAGTATYGSDVRTPVSATPVKGKTFRGWRFSKPETTNLSD